MEGFFCCLKKSGGLRSKRIAAPRAAGNRVGGRGIGDVEPD
jgi:hypothetical protein